MEATDTTLPKWFVWLTNLFVPLILTAAIPWGINLSSQIATLNAKLEQIPRIENSVTAVSLRLDAALISQHQTVLDNVKVLEALKVRVEQLEKGK